MVATFNIVFSDEDLSLCKQAEEFLGNEIYDFEFTEAKRHAEHMFSDYPNGYSYIGAGKVALDKVCAPTGLIWEIQNGILQIKRKNDTMSRQVFVISPDSGLIGIPKKLTTGAENDDDEPKNGWEVVCFLNGAIGVGDYVKIESDTVTGYFRVHTIEHDGDNLEGDWLSTAQVYEV